MASLKEEFVTLRRICVRIGSSVFENCITNKLRNMFLIRNILSFQFIEPNISTNVGTTNFDMHHQSGSVSQAVQKTSEQFETEKKSYKTLMSQLNWLTTNTKPNINFDICNLNMTYIRAIFAFDLT